jgi:ArsR family metal-binding transcriptional regulator
MINSISRNHEFLILKESAMTATIAKLVERLAEMFPKQNYQSKLDAYLTNKNVQDISDVEHWTREFDRRGSYL